MDGDLLDILMFSAQHSQAQQPPDLTSDTNTQRQAQADRSVPLYKAILPYND